MTGILKQAEQYAYRMASAPSVLSTKELMSYQPSLGALSDPAYSSHPHLLDDIKQNGITNPVWLSTNGKDVVIEDGKHRVNAAHQLGISHVPFVLTKRKHSPAWAKPMGDELRGLA